MASQTSIPDFAAFKATFNGDIVTPSDPDYASAIARWAINAERRASIVAFVKDEADVVLAINYARDNSLPIAIRGGAHNSSGTSSSEDGLVIDLSRYIKTVKVDQERKVIHVGGGALWGDVDREAIKYGMATVGGTVNDTGVGGLILGGGFGWLTPQHGLTIDNLSQATVVTAGGSILNANAVENSDLFWAIRGGGSNFGVVTEFVLKLHSQRRTVFAGALIFAPQALERLVSVTTEWWAKAGEKEGMFQIATVLPDGKPAIILSLFYNGSEAEGRSNYQAFFDIGPIVDRTREMPYEEVNTLQNAAAAVHGHGRFLKGVTPRAPHYPSIAQAQTRAADITKSPTSDGFRVTLGFEYLPMDKVACVPRSATAFRRDPAPNVLVMIAWTKDSKASIDKARAYANEIADILVDHRDDKESSLGYSNYDADAGHIASGFDKSKVVFAENYPKLQEIKKRYDPTNIFNKWFPITPAL